MSKLPFNSELLSAEDKQIYESLVAKRKAKGAPFDGPYAALMNHPQLCQKIEALGYYLKFEGHLSREVYQFVVLTVAKETGADFEWSDHVHHALAAGVPQAVIDLIKNSGLSDNNFPEPFRLAVEILRSTLRWQNIPEAVQTASIKEYGMYGFIEIVVLSGFYQMFSGINQGFDIRPR